MMKEYKLPEDWKYIYLRDIADVISGVSFKPEDLSTEGIRILRSGNIQNGYIILKEDDVYLDSSYYNKANTLDYLDNCITASTGSIEVLGKCGTVFEKIDSCQIGAFMRIVRAKNIEDALYLSLILHSPLYYQYIRRLAKNGTSINNIKNEHLEDFKFPYPSPQIKKKISKLYYEIEKKIMLNTRLNAELEAMAKQLYDYWFVQFDFPDENGRPYKSSGGKMVYNEKLKREIPLGWEIIHVNDILGKVKSTPRLQTDEYHKQGIFPIIDQTTDIYYAGFTDNVDAVLYQYPAVVFGDHSCAVKYVNFPFVRGADGTQIMISNNLRISIEYLYFSVKNIKVNKGYARHYGFIKDSLIIEPSQILSRKYSSVTEKLFKQITKLRIEINYLTHLRDSLLPMLMNGQVTIESSQGV